MVGPSAQHALMNKPDILSRLESCTNLPTPPDVATRIIDLAKDPEADIGKLADIIRMDPALTAKILRVTNSPMYALRRKTENLRQAIMLLGLNGTLSLALTFSLATAMRGDSRQGFNYDLFWRRSLASATCCRRLGMAIDMNNGEELFLAALLQDIGMLVLDKMDPEFYQSLDVDQSDHTSLQAMEIELLGADHAAIGGWILFKWGVPEYLQYGVLGSHDPASVVAEEDYGQFIECVSVSGPLVDAMSNQEDEQTLLATLGDAAKRLDIEQTRLAELLEQLNADFEEASSLFTTDLKGYQCTEGLMDQARETLILRNLQIIQQSDHMQRATEQLEARTRDLEEKSRRDGLTGLFNRVYLDQATEKEFELAKSHDWPLTVMFVDLDHFKSVNDTYGHPAGDEVLKTAAKLLIDGTRDDDVVARYGGEEFVIILTGTGESGARVVAERLVNAFRSTSHPVEEGKEIVVTASVGMAVMGGSQNFETAVELVTSADKAVYGAKMQGRDRYVVYGDEQ